VPPVFVDRLGFKAWTSAMGGQDNSVERALLLQAVSTVDENGQPVAKGTKVRGPCIADVSQLTQAVWLGVAAGGGWGW
jgi:hypothetical protein